MKTSASHTGELWETTHQWLGLSGNAVSKKYCREEIGTHPDYPALTSLTDFLDAGGLEYNAVQADATYIGDFNYPLLAHIQEPGREYLHIINQQEDWLFTESLTQFWSGIVVYSEKNSIWQNSDNDARLKQSFYSKFHGGALFLTALLLFSYTIYNDKDITNALFGILSFIGLLISILIIGKELGIQNNFVKQVCGSVSKGGCDKVLQSGYARGIAGLTMGDISATYFGTQFVSFFSINFFPSLFEANLLFSLSGVLVAGWSILTQALWVEKWCALCLAIVGVLLLQFSVSGYITYNQGFSYVTWLGTSFFLILWSIIALLLLPIKKALKLLYSSKPIVAEFKRWKLDPNIFDALLVHEKLVDSSIWENDLILGNPAAPIRILVACHPYCEPCADGHRKLEKILERHPDKVSVLVRFLCDPEDESDRRTKIVKSFLQLRNSQNNNLDLQRSLTDWFEQMSYDSWTEKWQPDKLNDVKGDLEKHRSWINESGIYATPTFFVNSRRLPGRYTLADLEKLIPHLSK